MENEKLKDYFTRYPNSDEVYENDGVLFHNRGAADSFGNAKETVRHTKAKVMAETILPEGGDDEAAKTAAIELIKATDVETLDYNGMKAISKDLQLVKSDKKAETLKAALVEYKTKLTAE